MIISGILESDTEIADPVNNLNSDTTLPTGSLINKDNTDPAQNQINVNLDGEDSTENNEKKVAKNIFGTNFIENSNASSSKTAKKVRFGDSTLYRYSKSNLMQKPKIFLCNVDNIHCLKKQEYDSKYSYFIRQNKIRLDNYKNRDAGVKLDTSTSETFIPNINFTIKNPKK